MRSSSARSSSARPASESHAVVDLRRDTITLPTRDMKAKAFAARLGDAVYGEDPSQHELETYAAQTMGKEAALFAPSGTMGNLICVLAHTERGDEIIVEENAHIRTSETGGVAAVAGVMVRAVAARDGVLSAQDLERSIREENIHYPPTTLVCAETPHYRYGGIVPPIDRLRELWSAAKTRELSVHLDGARLHNAAVCLGVEVEQIAQLADSVMVSLSKGLGAPAGAIVCGSREFIDRADRYRKMLGGGMRQTGWLCASGLYALSPQNAIQLATDHEHARLLAEMIVQADGIRVNLERVHTNFVLAEVDPTVMEADLLVSRLQERGVLATLAGPSTLRFVLCREVSRAQVVRAAETIQMIVHAGS